MDIIYRVDIHRVNIYRVGIYRVDIHRVFASLELSLGLGGALWRSPVCTTDQSTAELTAVQQMLRE